MEAVENLLYLVISGNVGDVAAIESYLVRYGQAAIFTRRDLASPAKAKGGEAEPNVETVFISRFPLARKTSRTLRALRRQLQGIPDIGSK